MLLILDFENTYTEIGDGKTDPRPFQPENRLVSAGWQLRDPETGSCVEEEYQPFYHKDLAVNQAEAHNKLQAALDQTSLLIAHHAKYELLWLWECGFTYNGPVYCTMIGEYVLLRGLKYPVNLADSAKRREVAAKKKDLTQDYLDKGIQFDEMPWSVVEEYGRQDVQTCWELYAKQQRIYQESRNQGLIPTLDMMNEFQVALADTERNGICIDLEALAQARKELEDERAELQMRMREICWKVMGDTPINFASGEQLSQLIYSRKVKDKKHWKKLFNLGTNERGKPLPRPRMSKTKFAQVVRDNTDKVYRTKAERCGDCKGKGSYYKTKKDGGQYARPTKCSTCSGEGILYTRTGKYGGFKLSPKDVYDVADGGFSTSKTVLERLRSQAHAKNYPLAAEFLQAAIRLNAIEHYLSSFVRGIERSAIPIGDARAILHPKFNQCVTKTGRLSSSEPNFQNLPRGDTFTLRKVIISRWPEGSILENDYEQLEFRMAGHLAKDEQVVADVVAGHDVHSYTASVLTESGQSTDRQHAKAHTFKPLYGGTSGTEAEQAYYQSFLGRYPGIREWQDSLQDEAIKNKKIKLPSGREYAFPNAQRMPWGGASGATQIKNFPVQGYATADVVPLAFIRVWKRMCEEQVQSLLIITVHDSLEVDVYPGEEALMARLVTEEMLAVAEELENRYGDTLFVPIGTEAKIGPNWLDMKKVKQDEALKEAV